MPKGLNDEGWLGGLPGLGMKHTSAEVAEVGIEPGWSEEAASP